MSLLQQGHVHALPLIHGRLAFAMEAHRRLLSESFAAVAVELPASLERGVLNAVDALPVASAVLYREQLPILEPDAPAFFVPVHPGDGMVEALRIAKSERIPVFFVDAEIGDFLSRGISMPDPHALHSLGLEAWLQSCLPSLSAHPRNRQDEIRERHMAASLRRLEAEIQGPILFLTGMAHWLEIRRLLAQGEGELWDADGPDATQTEILQPLPRSLPFIMGDMPYLVAAYEQHRRGISLEPFDPVQALKSLLLEARSLHQKKFGGSLERAHPQALRVLMDFARKMTVRRKLLLPDSYTLVTAARGVVGNDYALCLLEMAHAYPWNGRMDLDGSQEVEQPVHPLLAMNADRGRTDDADFELRNRTPGSEFEYGRLQLERPPDARRQRQWQQAWDPRVQCSWPPEDVVIEGFRDYVGRRALSLASVQHRKIEPFSTSLMDGIDFRESMRDVVERRVFVKEEPRLPGGVGALVVIFEEDDFGIRYPWRSTWLAEHHNESTLAFYATDFHERLIGPGVARSFYGGYLLVYPPKPFPDIWQDARFERARTPSERLLLAAIYWSEDPFVVHLADKAPAEEVRREAERRKRHILHMPLSTFQSRSLEQIRHFHVLNGSQVRSWAGRFIRRP
ncbi:MAG: hypothetical protein DWQ01_11205 [Planctomycetota bacterium]|nr:MAG: hypothetical protein DWQ01_11205 [Planctomycetota bacterium]